jgi:hypothetical protein
VEASDATLDTKILVIVLTDFLRGKLFEAVGVLWLRWPRVCLFEPSSLYLCVELLTLGVDAR